MPDERFEEHLRHPQREGHRPAGAHLGASGGAACGDLVTLRVAVEGDRVSDTGFEAAGCGAASAAGSAAVALVHGASLMDAARVGTAAISAELGGLSPGKHHAAELAADALHRALGAAVRRARLPAHPGRTLVAMSGGVDNSVAALLCARDDDVAGVTLELWRDPDNDAERSCCSASAVRSARALAHGMGLAHFTLDLRDEFRSGVVEPWIAEHAAGRTPNPCVRCNGQVRLDAMVELADRLGAQRLATGHYARVTADGLLRAAADPAKDQSYMLAALAPPTIARLRFPLGDLTKARVRGIAAQAGLPVAGKADSQDLCFLAGTRRAAFLARHGGLRDRPGDVVDRGGRRLGRHRGSHHFTVGQRRGIEVGGGPEPVFVLATRAADNTVVVGPRESLGVTEVAVSDVRLHRPAGEVDGVRLRYRAPAVGARLDGDRVLLDEVFQGAAPGQAAVLLRGDVVIGCATIALGR